ncbi:HET-domain-containing protein [Venturia nashicola]|uniref:HET-domain-containing protein n=1 Tax=Venturia nashicola TaxID=86259 RepID=A0A4Z1PP33_9PEZI|nr:HET-domain-containing protein [Venturia nashicola]
MDLPPYQYQALPTEDTIRIVVLEPAERYEADLKCHILIRSRLDLFRSTDNRINSYEAISYAWGEPTFTKTLVCDETSLLKITSNVDDMLRSLRKTHRSRNLWIDAVSLNQADLQERSQQVPLMGNIYHQASKGIVWLGTETPGTKDVFAFLRVLATLRISDSHNVDDIAAVIFGATQDAHVFLESFLGRPWFQRRWILQEAAKARSVTVRCGRERISWRWLVDAFAVLSLQPHPALQAEVSERAWRALDTVRTIQSHGSLMLELLWEVDHAQCSDPRDRLFALYGLANSVPNSHALPAAKYDVLWESIYAQFATSCISSGQFIELVRHITAFGRLRDSDTTMPSWIPDWRRTRSKQTPAWLSSPQSLQSQGSSKILWGQDTPTVSHAGNRLSLSSGFGISRPITHIFRPTDLGLWKFDDLKDWPWAVHPEVWSDSYDISKEAKLWSWNQKQILEVLCRALSFLSLPDELSVEDETAVQFSLRYFSGDQTISAESMALRMTQLTPCIRLFLRQYALFCWANVYTNSRTPVFGLGISSVAAGDRVVSRSRPDSQTLLDEGNAVGAIVRPAHDHLSSVISGKVIGVAIFAKSTLPRGTFTSGRVELI